MGSSLSKPNTRCDNNEGPPEGSIPPPTMQRPMTFEEKMYQKVSAGFEE